LSKEINSTIEGINIYITSDEEIKEGNSIFETDTNTINIAGKDYVKNEFDFKIILTTDQDLIADGVQAIDNDFLEWFVKNPTREFVMTLPDVRGLRDIFQPTGKDLYKIIIPQDESYRLERNDGEVTIGTEISVNQQPKQERIADTIEEVEKKAMDLLKNKWSHLFVSGYPEKPYPTNFQNDLNNVMIGILSTSVSLQNVKKAQIEILELVQSKLDGNKTEENNFWHMINKIKKEIKSE
jgi:hypothetical protein